MKRRGAVKVSVAFILVVLLSVSTLRVRQAWGEQQAHAGFVAAQKSAATALSDAAAAGLFPGELAQYRNTKAALDAVPMPSSSILWGSQEAFYNREAAAYRTLIAQVNAQVARVEVRAHARAAWAVTRLTSAVDRAHAYGLPIPGASAMATRSRSLLARARTPVANRSLASKALATTARISAMADARVGYVAGLLQSSNNQLSSVVQHADDEASGAQTQLSLVSIFSSRGKQLAARIKTATAAVHAQTTAFNAAVREADLHDLIVQAGRLVQKVVPSQVIVVSTEDQWAHMYQNGQEVYNTPVTTGGPELPTDKGIFHIYAMISPFVFHSPWPEGSPYYYPPTPVTYWMPFDGAEGLHDASWRSNFGPGSNYAPTDLGTGNYILGTHGCVNLPTDAANWVWNWASVGTTVVVT